MLVLISVIFYFYIDTYTFFINGTCQLSIYADLEQSFYFMKMISIIRRIQKYCNNLFKITEFLVAKFFQKNITPYYYFTKITGYC